MSSFLKDKEHLWRMAALFAAGITVFFVARHFLVPEGFGVYGHYRAGALADNRVQEVHYAGRTTCEACHTDVVEARKASKHAGIGCEACHGPLAKHAADPAEVKPTLPDGRALCLKCHLANVAKPKGFPQIAIPEHGDTALCTTCHRPHSPTVQ